MRNRLFDAPIGSHPQRVLDIGTGTGIWCIDMADQYPSAEVIGTDITPIQPQWVPPNWYFPPLHTPCTTNSHSRFEMDDMEKEWTYQPDTFDFIHARNIAPSISDWPKLLAEAFRCVPPTRPELCADP